MWRRNQGRVARARNKKNNNNSSNKKNNATTTAKTKGKGQKLLNFEETMQMLAVVRGFGKTCQALLKTHKVLNSVTSTLPYWH